MAKTIKIGPKKQVDMREKKKLIDLWHKRIEVDVILFGLDDDEGFAVFEDAGIVYNICGVDFDESVQFFRVIFPSMMTVERQLVDAGYSVASCRQVGPRDVIRIVHLR
jgi:hypothetical protein